jgi:hypothetical protein
MRQKNFLRVLPRTWIRKYILTGSETGLPLEKTIYLLEMVNKGETKKRIIDFVESNNLADANGKFMITLFKNLRRE